MPDASGTRLVPMTKAQRDRLHLHGWRTESNAYDAAPADPAEALRQALAGWISGDPKVDLTDFSDDLDEVVTAVLAALGVPANPANEEHHA